MAFNKKFFTTGGIVASSPTAAELDPLQNFETVTYTGNGGTQSITSLDFQPDLVWVKNRDVAVNHYLYDSIRGTGAAKALHSNTTDSESTASTYSVNGGVQSIDSNGFTVFEGTDGTYQGTNKSGQDYVAWCWKAGGVPTPNNNTQGTITSTVSANQDAGFSIVKYTGTGSAGQNFGHGLSSAPEIFFIKRLTSSADWMAVAKIGSSYQRAKLNDTAAFSTSMSGATNGVDPTDTLITLGNSNSVNVSSNDFVAYCFHSVDGYQKVGSYEGTGVAGLEVTGLGFAPRFVMLKNADSTGSWIIHSKPPTTTNPSVYHLRANTNGVEDNGANEQIDFDDDGFTLNGTGSNANSNNTYIYLAIA